MTARARLLDGHPIGVLALGGMRLSFLDPPAEADAVALIHLALDSGVRLLDTADAYCTGHHDIGHNERLMAKAVRTWDGPREQVLIATKGGHTRPPDDSWGLDGSPTYLRKACQASLRALGTDRIDLYQLHRPDPAIPFAESVDALVALRDEGLVQRIGVSNVNPEQIRVAHELGQISAVQNEYSPSFQSSAREIDVCDELGIAFLAWAPLGGMNHLETLERNHPHFAELSTELGVSPQQLGLAWMLARSPALTPVLGARQPKTFKDSLGAIDLELSPAQLARLNQNR